MEVDDAALVEDRARGAVLDGLRHVVDVDVVAEDLARRAVLLRNRGPREADVGGIRQGVAHQPRRSRAHTPRARVDVLLQPVLAAVRLVDHHHDVAALRQRPVTLLELLHRREEDAVCLTPGQQLAQMGAARRLHGHLPQKVAALRKLTVQLPVEVVAVGQHDNRRRGHRPLQPLGKEDHRQRLAASLRVPEYPAAAVRLGGAERRFDGLAHGVELVVGAQYLDVLPVLLRAADEAAEQLDEAALLEHPAEEDVEIGVARVLQLAVHGLPLHESVLTRRDGPGLGRGQVAHYAEGVVDEQRGNLLHVVAQLGIGLRDVSRLARGGFQLDDHQRQPVDEDDDVGPAHRTLLDRPLVRDREPVAHREVVIHQPHQPGTLFAAVEVVDRHAVLEHVGEPGVFAGERTAFDVSDAGDCLVDGGARERGVYADECIFENLHTEGLCEVPHDIGAVEVLVTEQVSEDFEDGVFEIGFGEGHKFTFFTKLRENRESQRYG